MLEIESTTLPEVRILRPKRFGDHRGFFSEVYNRARFAEAGIDIDFMQDNHSLSADVGTVRGLHFQSPPFAQDKLVRVVRGAILDIVVDIRRSSPNFGRHVSVELSAENWAQLLVPIGFAHGFCTLQPDSEVIYKVSAHYAPENDHGLAWDDPDLGIEWPVTKEAAILSAKDRQHPRLADLPLYFA
ncbi:dTDP-4-dehydrorhamnose 3,5-epimerase (plasmid) [Roseomonas sp. FDAARGOS_362]|uniref:dTDP-4-dehydrorhamnose 3,5-epimerase n=1 Tax=Roseomonas sp. FDAARGOS_362 TaxID=2018065 RepID=UPI000C17A82D|nr:dTDP-4-dehydrorhamnose 3,5-epimerase [Roseomonas sp. FDAARGOS_362]ATR19528.1 dTDP-4-dehydrorhamnose 3,5-epimerase [Roseomonas sp. FDAARGOS_362]